MQSRSLFFGDNLEILKEKFPEDKGYFDLIYLDPPFNSNKNYNVLFREGLVDSEAQTHAFEDTWHWTPEAKSEFDWLVANSEPAVSDLMQALRGVVGPKGNDMLAYLTMMTRRLVELHRVLKSTGSIYLHCDPTASHYLKLVLDVIFGKQNFRNEIVWKRTFAHNDPKRFGRNDDRIFFYTKSEKYTFNPVFMNYDQSYVESFFRHKDARGEYQAVVLTGPKVNPRDPTWKGYNPSTSGRSWSIPKRIVNHLAGDEHAKKLTAVEKLDLLDKNGYIVFSKNGIPRFKQYLHEMEGAPAQEIWTDIGPISAHATERLHYPTQKPEALLERIVNASSKEGDWVMDPFCGCGTTVSAAEKLRRNWVGIDISMLAVKLIERRLVKSHPELINKIHINGLPKDMAAARELAVKEPFDFEYWVAVHLLDAKPPSGKSKENMRGADRGVDGLITLITDVKDGENKYGKVLVQVKGGKVQRNDISTLISDIQRDNAVAGVFVTLQKPTSQMRIEESEAGSVRTGFGILPKIQILTVEELLNGKRPNLPGMVSPYKQALVFNPTIPQTSLL